jgi:hypothetical protein
MDKRFNILAIVIAALLLSATTVYAFSSYLATSASQSGFKVNYSFVFPENGSIFPNVTTLWAVQYNMTTNSSFNGTCSFMIRNNNTWFPMEASADSNRTWTNSSAFNYAPGDNAWNDLRFRCMNISSANVTFTNSSVYQYKLTSSKSFNIDIEVGPVNGTYYKSIPIFNISMFTSPAPAGCWYVLNGTVVIAAINTTATNYSAVQNIYYTNSTPFDSPNITAYGEKPQNLTFYCTDAFANKTWFNTSTSLSNYSTFWYGSMSMAHSAEAYVAGNYTTGGNYFNATWTVSDNVPLTSCGVHGYHEDGLVTNFSSSSSMVTGASLQNCTVRILPDDITKNGKYILEPYAADVAGNTGKAATNKTVILTKLYTGWNLISIPYNYTLSKIAAISPNISYVSVYGNGVDYKNYTTYTTGSATNAAYGVNMSNATYIYATANTVLMMNFTNLENGTATPGFQIINLWGNTSAKFGWNQMGMIIGNVPLNSTISSSNCNNVTYTVTNESRIAANLSLSAVTYPKILTSLSSVTNFTHTISLGNFTNNATHVNFTSLGAGAAGIDHALAYNYSYTWVHDYIPSTCTNLTYASYYSATLGKYCTAVRGKTVTSCYPTYTSLNLSVPSGSAIWIYSTNANITYNRTMPGMT